MAAASASWLSAGSSSSIGMKGTLEGEPQLPFSSRKSREEVGEAYIEKIMRQR